MKMTAAIGVDLERVSFKLQDKGDIVYEWFDKNHTQNTPVILISTLAFEVTETETAGKENLSGCLCSLWPYQPERARSCHVVSAHFHSSKRNLEPSSLTASQTQKLGYD